MYLIDRVTNNAKVLAVLVGAILTMLICSPRAEGVELTNGFSDLIGTPSSTLTVQNYTDWGPNPDTLMIRDPVTGIASPVPDTGIWRMGFGKYAEEGMQIKGYANNDNNVSKNTSGNTPGHEVWCTGSAHDELIGSTADLIYVIQDNDANGIGTLEGGNWTLGGDDILYTSADIEFNGQQGDLSQLGTFDAGAGYYKALPQMTIDARPPRNEPATLIDLANMGAYWLSQDCSPETNSDCEGADWDFDGDVDIKDFADMASHWLE